jgi:hypothetical protein
VEPASLAFGRAIDSKEVSPAKRAHVARTRPRARVPRASSSSSAGLSWIPSTQKNDFRRARSCASRARNERARSPWDVPGTARATATCGVFPIARRAGRPPGGREEEARAARKLGRRLQPAPAQVLARIDPAAAHQRPGTKEKKKLEPARQLGAAPPTCASASARPNPHRPAPEMRSGGGARASRACVEQPRLVRSGGLRRARDRAPVRRARSEATSSQSFLPQLLRTPDEKAWGGARRDHFAGRKTEIG